MSYMLDTNTCIYTIKRHPPEVKRKLVKVPPGEVVVSSITVAELWFGVSESSKQEHNATALAEFLHYAVVLPWPQEAAPVYGQIRSTLKRKGTPMGAMDLLIAAHAVHSGFVLVTNNTKEFQRVPSIKVENWVRQENS